MQEKKVGFIGTTGGGKSTTVDLLMSLLKPTKGKIYADGEELNISKNHKKTLAWRRNIAYVPQNIFLTDGTILENIAFGVTKSEIDISKVKESVEKAMIVNLLMIYHYAIIPK